MGGDYLAKRCSEGEKERERDIDKYTCGEVESEVELLLPSSSMIFQFK